PTPPPRPIVWLHVCGHDLVDPRQRRGATFHRGPEFRYRGGGAPHFCGNAPRGVAPPNAPAQPPRPPAEETPATPPPRRAHPPPLADPRPPHRFRAPGRVAVHCPSVARPCPKLPDDDHSSCDRL